MVPGVCGRLRYLEIGQHEVLGKLEIDRVIEELIESLYKEDQ